MMTKGEKDEYMADLKGVWNMLAMILLAGEEPDQVAAGGMRACFNDNCPAKRLLAYKESDDKKVTKKEINETT